MHSTIWCKNSALSTQQLSHIPHFAQFLYLVFLYPLLHHIPLCIGFSLTLLILTYTISLPSPGLTLSFTILLSWTGQFSHRILGLPPLLWSNTVSCPCLSHFHFLLSLTVCWWSFLKDSQGDTIMLLNFVIDRGNRVSPTKVLLSQPQVIYLGVSPSPGFKAITVEMLTPSKKEEIISSLGLTGY